MKFTYKWLQDFVQISLKPAELAHRLTMAGIEVGSCVRADDDVVFEAEITSNRPDWLSIRGIAREVAAVTGKKFKEAKARSGSRAGASARTRTVPIQVASVRDCPRYTARIIEGVQVGPSPAWLRRRLESLGCRSVNNIVDVTNYILYEYGEPLHAFDRAALRGDGIRVRRARRGETISAIDGKEYRLTPGMLVIADQSRPVALAGVIGGKESEVSGATTDILLEAALFDQVGVRRTRQELGVNSESSYRFERGVDPAAVDQAAEAAVRMILDLAGGRMTGYGSAGSSRSGIRRLRLDVARAQAIIGAQVSSGKMTRILNDLGLTAWMKSKTRMEVVVPSRRSDIQGEEDLIEEIARIYGYDAIPATLPAVKPAVTGPTDYDRTLQLTHFLAGAGLYEVKTYSLVSESALDAFRQTNGPSQNVALHNPLSSEYAVLRSSLIPGLTAAAALNFNQRQEYVALFEIAHVFCAGPTAPREVPALGIVIAGARAQLLAEGKVVDRATLLHVKGVIESLLARFCGKKCRCSQLDGSRHADIELAGTSIGKLGIVPPAALQQHHIKNKQLFAAEIFLEPVFELMQQVRRFMPLPRYPAITRDISCVLKNAVSTAALLEEARSAGKPLLQQIRITDFYRGAHIPADHRGLTVSCLYQSTERTLTEQEITPVHQIVCQGLTERFGAVLR